MGESGGLSIERSWVRNLPVPFRILGKFVYPTMPKSLGMLLVYPKRMAVGVKTKDEFFTSIIYMRRSHPKNSVVLFLVKSDGFYFFPPMFIQCSKRNSVQSNSVKTEQVSTHLGKFTRLSAQSVHCESVPT